MKLNKDICKKCINKYRIVSFVSSQGWDERVEKFWSKDERIYHICPDKVIPGEGTRTFSILKYKLPYWCPRTRYQSGVNSNDLQ
jgi:hypothetical protein